MPLGTSRVHHNCKGLQRKWKHRWLLVLFLALDAHAQSVQQGPRLLVPQTGDGSAISFGSSVAVSGDGSLALVGGPGDAQGSGAAWICMRVGGGWALQAVLRANN